MNIDSIEQKVKEIIYSCLNNRIAHDDITKEKDLIYDLRVESFELIQIFYSIAAEFSIALDKNELGTLKSVYDIVMYIHNKDTV